MIIIFNETVFVFALFIDVCFRGAEDLSAFGAQLQFLLDFYISFFRLSVGCCRYYQQMFLFFGQQMS